MKPNQLLTVSASKNDAGGVRAALEQGAEVNARNKNGVSALSAACAKGFDGIVAILLLQRTVDVNLANRAPAAPERPLDVALASGHAAIAHRLLDAGVSVDADAWGNAPVTRACALKDASLVRRMVELNPELAERNADTMASAACRTGAVSVFDVVVSAAAGQCAALAQVRLSGGLTLLMVTAESGSLAIAERLIAAGADVNAVDLGGHSAVRHACTHNQAEFIRLLTGAGAVALCKHLARSMFLNVGVDCLRALVEGGADFNELSPFQHPPMTPAQRAFRGGCVEVARFFASLGARPSGVNMAFVVPAMRAVTLAASGADVSQLSEVDEELRDLVNAERRLIARANVDLVRRRAFEICIAVQGLRLPSNVTLGIIDAACFWAQYVPVEKKRAIVTRVTNMWRS